MVFQGKYFMNYTRIIMKDGWRGIDRDGKGRHYKNSEREETDALCRLQSSVACASITPSGAKRKLKNEKRKEIERETTKISKSWLYQKRPRGTAVPNYLFYARVCLVTTPTLLPESTTAQQCHRSLQDPGCSKNSSSGLCTRTLEHHGSFISLSRMS